jgi:hypothetical protein
VTVLSLQQTLSDAPDATTASTVLPATTDQAAAQLDGGYNDHSCLVSHTPSATERAPNMPPPPQRLLIPARHLMMMLC